MSAIAAVDMALWDIKAKVAGLPLYQLLGGACRDGVRSIAMPMATPSRRQSLKPGAIASMGYTAIRLQSGVPGLPSTYGVSHDKMFYEPADADAANRERLVNEKYLPSVPKLFEAARDALGWDVHLLHDIHHRLTPIEAARLGKDLEPYRLFWLEDAVVAENQANFRLIRQHTTTPLAVGEVFNSIWDCKQLIEEQLIDYIRATVVHAGGITHLRRIASSGRSTIMCGPAVMAPPTCRRSAWPRRCISMSRSPISAFQEYMRHTPETDAVFPHAIHFATARCIRARRRAWAWISTRSWPRNIPTSAPICR